MAGCCDAERGEPCQSGGTVTFQRTGITLLTLLLWLEFSPSSLGDDLTLFTLRRDAGGGSKLVPHLLHPPLCLSPISSHVPLQAYFFPCCFFFFLRSQPFSIFYKHSCISLLNHSHIHRHMFTEPIFPRSCSHCHLKIMYHKICNFCCGFLLLLCVCVCVFVQKHTHTFLRLQNTRKNKIVKQYPCRLCDCSQRGVLFSLPSSLVNSYVTWVISEHTQIMHKYTNIPPQCFSFFSVPQELQIQKKCNIKKEMKKRTNNPYFL